MLDKVKLKKRTYEKSLEILRVGNQAVSEAQAESRAKKVPNVYSFAGRIYYELEGQELGVIDPYSS